MIRIFIAFIFAIAGFFLFGLLNLSIANAVVIVAVPFVFIYKLFGNRPSFFMFAAFAAAFAGGFSLLHGYIIAPIEYYYSIWGWGGVVAGVIAAILLPLEAVLFLAVTYFKGGAGIYVVHFFGGICFGISGFLLYAAAMPKWMMGINDKKSLVTKDE